MYEASSLGYDLKFAGPETVEEYDQKAGKVGSCLEDAIMNIIYRSTLVEWQSAFAKAIETITGEKRGTNAEQTAKAQARADKAAEKAGKPTSVVKPVLETVKSYYDRVVAPYVLAEDKDKIAEFALAAETAAESIVVDPSPSTRAASINKGDLAKADQILTLSVDEIEAKVAKIEAVVGTEIIERDEETSKPTRESLAKAIGAWVKASL